ncbi:hypothetical protein ACWDV4_08150 [Micromonospora sp. NPDC003197]
MPRQATPGRVYGSPDGPGPAEMTMALPFRDPSETSGSLTGHILAQGWADTPDSVGSNAKVMIMLLVGLGVVVIIGLVLAITAGDAISSVFNGILGS